MKSNRRPERDVRPAGELGGRRILLGVTGGIAAYKAVELARLFIQSGAKVQVIMTSAATKFVAPLTFEAITARTVFVEMFPNRVKSRRGTPNSRRGPMSLSWLPQPQITLAAWPTVSVMIC